MVRNTTKLNVSVCPTNGIWFSMFILGLHKCMGIQRKQDLGIFIDVMLGIQYILEEDWGKADSLLSKKGICEVMMMYLGTFCWGVCSEELLLVHLGATL